MPGAATSCEGPHVRSLQTSEVLYRFRAFPARGELAARGMRRLQCTFARRPARLQKVAAISGR
eukprot:9481423-Pyramimonas_sp.AAC.1